MADRHRIQLDWLTGQQHRAHVMTTPHGASTRKGAISPAPATGFGLYNAHEQADTW
ncbi:hypothetical protein L1085_000015 [Streptomyces sp. MSC1_001]|uniref:hypothetical protein n=1 Tax=Streptomyces sp. MSC1_001 TaxID=2909263 RepID=UPI00202DE7E7|nr:hypothetical protein [Streptomyces sp. MSC1_001]